MPGFIFPGTARLQHPREFKRVFATGLRQSDPCFTVLSLVNTGGEARLGLVAARKNIRRAVDRNRIKRVIRESFRRQRSTLPPRDFVIMIRSTAGNRPSAALQQSLAQHWQRIVRNQPQQNSPVEPTCAR